MSSSGTVWSAIEGHVAKRQEVAQPVDGLTRSLGFVLASEFPQEPRTVMERLADEYEVLYRQAHGDDPNNELQADREAAKGTLPTARQGRSDPTASQAEARIRLAKVDAKLQRIAEQHHVPLVDKPGSKPRCTVCAHPERSSIDQLLAAGWTLDQVADEVQSLSRLTTALGLQAKALSRSALGRHNKHSEAAVQPTVGAPEQAPTKATDPTGNPTSDQNSANSAESGEAA